MHLFWIHLYLFIRTIVGQSELVGHLKPLGYQHPPTIFLDEFEPENAPTPEEFYNNYVKPAKPAIFRNAITNTKAFKEWTDDYLKTNYGNLEVRLEGKKEKADVTPIGEKYLGRDTIRHFVENYHSPDSFTYIVSELPKQMYKDVGVIPSLGACGQMTKHFVEIDLWWSGGGSSSIMHKDAFNQINCLYRGTKHWKIFQYKYEKWLYKHWEPKDPLGGFSDINVEAVDLKKHPKFLNVPWSNFTINAGDCLYLPRSDYHQVNSDGPNNLAVSILFGRFHDVKFVDFSDCNAATDYKLVRPLSDFDIMWQWEGKGTMSMGYGDHEEAYREPLLNEVRQLNKRAKKFNFKHFKLQFSDDDVLDGVNDGKKYIKAFKVLDTNDDEFLSEEEVTNATYEQFRKLGALVEPYEPSNSYKFEYSVITFWDVYRLVSATLRDNEDFIRSEWIKSYQKLGGTVDFAQEIYTKIVQSNQTESIKSDDVSHDDVHRGLANWKSHWAAQYAGSDDPNKMKEKPWEEEDGEEDEEERNRDHLVDEL